MNLPSIYQSVPSRTGPELKAEFQRLGVSMADWARANGFSPALVYQILAGRKRCVRGQSHQIAVALGLKQGQIGSLSDIGARHATEQKSRSLLIPAGGEAGIEGGTAP